MIRGRPRLARVAAAPPERVGEGVWLIRGGIRRVMNVYLIEDGESAVVFDAGEKGMAYPIAASAARLGGISRVVLGHADTDHRGAAPALSALAPVHCHPDAVADAEGDGGVGRLRLEQLDWPTRKQQELMHAHVWDGGPVKIDGTVEGGDEVAGFEVVEFPGHAPGQVGLFRESDGLALTSDCFYMTTLWGRETPAQVPHPVVNLDTDRALE